MDSSLSGDNSTGHVWLDRSGRLLEAARKRCPRGMAVTHRGRKRAVPYRTRLTGRLIFVTKGSAHPAGPFTLSARLC